jgi:hypothetical protein
MAAFMQTRISVRDYESWKPMFDADAPAARASAKGHRLFRSLEDPNDVVALVEFETAEEAREARERLLASGVLDRVRVTVGPTIIEEVETIAYQHTGRGPGAREASDTRQEQR